MAIFRTKYDFVLQRCCQAVSLAMSVFLASVSGAQDLPRQLPASVAVPAPYVLPSRMEPKPDFISTTTTGPEVINTPQIVGHEVVDGSPMMMEAGDGRFTDMFPQSDTMYVDGNFTEGGCVECPPPEGCWTSQILPEGLIWHSYLAGPKEPRMAAVFWHDRDLGWQLDYTVGGRVGLFRYGSQNNFWPEGFQVDLEGAAFPRTNLSQNWDLDAADYRVGIPFTYGIGKWQTKFEVYHLSAHVGDEFLIRNPGFQRINYVRDAAVLGGSYYPIKAIRLYGEVEYAFNTDGGAKPWAFQFGAECSPMYVTDCCGAPFAAINAYLRQDVNYGGNVNLQIGWQWRGESRRLLRTGFHCQTGKSNQFEFFTQTEQQVGIGVWYDY